MSDWYSTPSKYHESRFSGKYDEFFNFGIIFAQIFRSLND